ncbi:hypothetical protein GCM10010420_25790 [Streptomyces glaucosporus]|uniref:Uncharacterized protein n=1 Tax=Streptomyces glaucosporus TaxID=284044 RepID=A0ABN3IAV1_9ACTN
MVGDGAGFGGAFFAAALFAGGFLGAADLDAGGFLTEAFFAGAFLAALPDVREAMVPRLPARDPPDTGTRGTGGTDAPSADRT